MPVFMELPPVIHGAPMRFQGLTHHEACTWLGEITPGSYYSLCT